MISIFTTITDPIRRQDPVHEALACYNEVADEVVLVDGGNGDFLSDVKVVDSDWPYDFSFELIGQQFQKGYEACKGDWAIKMDLDTFIHEDDIEKLKQILDYAKDDPAICFVKMNWVKDNLFLPKSRVIFAINKKKCGDHITWDASDTKSKPAYDGQEFRENKLLNAIPIYNYHFAFKCKEQIVEDRYRFAKAWERMTGSKAWRPQTPQSAYEHFITETKERYKKYKNDLVQVDHPKYVDMEALPEDRLYHWIDEIY